MEQVSIPIEDLDPESDNYQEYSEDQNKNENSDSFLNDILKTSQIPSVESVTKPSNEYYMNNDGSDVEDQEESDDVNDDDDDDTNNDQLDILRPASSSNANNSNTDNKQNTFQPVESDNGIIFLNFLKKYYLFLADWLLFF